MLNLSPLSPIITLSTASSNLSHHLNLIYPLFHHNNILNLSLTNKQGIKAVIAESYERIHRSNLVGVGIIPMQYKEGETADTHGLTGKEKYSLKLPEDLKTGQLVTIEVCITSLVL